MDKELTLIFCIMSLMATTALAPVVLAQDNIDATVNATANATVNNTTANNSSLNSVDLNNTALNQTALDQAALDQTALNLSTADETASNVAPISDIAKVDPELAATASSVQVATNPEGVFKLGVGVGGRDLFDVKENGITTMELGIPIKPLRDVGKMVFVCDIV